MLALVVQISFAQGKVITGVVTEAGTGEPLPGVNVVVKGTSTGAATDFDGKYTIKAEKGQILVFSFIGYNTVERKVGDSNVINVELKESGEKLDDVVVTGVAKGTSTKKLGFVVDKVKVSGVKEVPTLDAASALSGKVAGAQIVKGSGNPLRNAAIVLRGASSIIQDSEPLIIIDGIITEGGLNDVNMEDVESIEVVKGAAASALYGSQAGNGVIQIVTKKGKGKDTKISFKSEYGISSISNDYPLATKHPYLVDNGELTGDYDPDNKFDNDFPVNIDNIDNVITSQPYIQNSVSISQGADKVNYFISYQNSTVDGIIAEIKPYERNSFRTNLSSNLTEKLKGSFTINYVKSTGEEVRQAGQGDNIFYNLLKMMPVDDVTEKNDDGEYLPYFDGVNSSVQNPLYVASMQDRDREENRLIGGVNFDYLLNDNWDVSTSFSMDKNDFDYVHYYPKGYETPVPNADINDGYMYVRNSVKTRYNSSAQLNYRKQLGDINFKSSLKYLYEDITYDRTSAEGSVFAAAGVYSLGLTTEKKDVGSYKYEIKNQDVFLTADVDWKDKVILSGLVRTDRSSLFGENNRDQVFYRGSLAYRLSEDLNKDWIDEFKLRLSYGTAGLRPRFGDIHEIFTVSDGIITFRQVGNPDLKSPTISEFETGFDFKFLNKYSLSFTYANSYTEDALLQVPLSAAVPGETQVQNAGDTQYTSYEFTFNGKPVETQNFTWNTGIVFSKVDNTYEKLNVAPFNRSLGGTLFDSAPASSVFRVEEGMPYGAMYGNMLATSLDDLTVVDGVVINEGLNLPIEDFTINEDGYVIVASQDGVAGGIGTGEQAIRVWDEETGDAKLGFIGDTNPDFNIGFSNTFSYKNLSLYTLIDVQKGGDVYNYTKQLLYYHNRHLDQQDYANEGQPVTYSDASSIIYNKATPIDYFVEDASYVKIREISLSYLLDKNVFGKALPIKSIKFTLSGRNLFTFTDYSGWDPEVAVLNNPYFKYDDFAYPNFRVFAGSVQINF